MIHFLKILSLLILILPVTNGVGASQEDTSSIERLQVAKSLQEVYEIAFTEFGNRLETWRSLKGGKDLRAQQSSKESLESLRKSVAVRCCALTGLTPDWGMSTLRIRHGFFTEAETRYKDFSSNLIKTLGEQSAEGKLSEEKGRLYGKLLGQAGQRAEFYKKAFTILSKDEETFAEGGAGSILSSFTAGVTGVLAEALGKYFYSRNTNLALLMVAKEDLPIAEKIASLLTSFHEPLAIEGEISYMLLLENGLAQERSALEGQLSLSQVQNYLDDESFWTVTPGALVSLESKETEGKKTDASAAQLQPSSTQAVRHAITSYASVAASRTGKKQ